MLRKPNSLNNIEQAALRSDTHCHISADSRKSASIEIGLIIFLMMRGCNLPLMMTAIHVSFLTSVTRILYTGSHGLIRCSQKRLIPFISYPIVSQDLGNPSSKRRMPVEDLAADVNYLVKASLTQALYHGFFLPPDTKIRSTFLQSS